MLAQRVTRHRKGFYQKQNDHCSFNLKQSTSHIILKSTSIPLIQQKKRIPLPTSTQQYCSLYTQQVLSNPINFIHPSNFLINHKIDWMLRARMLDWMIEVISQYKFINKTYFAAISIMDTYFQNERETIYTTKLHGVGTVAMMIATKMDQVYPLKLNTVYQKITHKKIQQNQIVAIQHRISLVLGYKLNSWTFYDLAIAKIHILQQNLNKRRLGTLGPSNNIQKSYYSANYYDQLIIKQIQQNHTLIQDVCSYLSKIVCFEYDFYCSNTLSVFSDVVLKLTFEILHISCQLQSICTSSQIQVQMCKQQLIERIRRFDMKFKGMNNLKRYTKQEVLKVVNGYIQ